MPESIDIWFLGSGCAVPTLKRWHPSILFRMNGNHFLFDCGEGTQLRLEEIKISPMKIDKIFITHWHADHFAGLLPLIETMHLEGRDRPLEIYAPEASKFVRKLLSLSYWGISFDIKTYDCSIRKKEKIFENDKYEIYSIPVRHTVPAVGYGFVEKPSWKIDMKLAKKYGLSQGPVLKEIKEKGKIKYKGKTIKLDYIANKISGRKIVYSGDTRICKRLFDFAKNSDILIHDGTFIEPVNERSHSSIKEVTQLAKKYKVKKLIITHLSRRYTDIKEIEKVSKRYYKNSVVAKDLMHIKL